ncbi:12685_t:CDS:2 [Entrophospora sp. SA101]|nr:12685_t:CDS:2 [Entrophospora sp. SA101]
MTLKKKLKRLEKGTSKDLESAEKDIKYDNVENFPKQKRSFLTNAFSNQLCPSSYADFNKFKEFQQKHNYPILCHRPTGASSIPVTLLHPAFGQFVSDCKNLIPTSDDIKFVITLSKRMSSFYDNENLRAEDFRTLITKYCDLTFVACKIGSKGYVTDGSLVTGDHYYVNIEAKVEFGSGGEGFFQSSMYYINMVLDNAKKYTGPMFCFAGSAIPKEVHMDQLTLPIPLSYNPYEKDIELAAARTFGAFKKAVHCLKSYYENELQYSINQIIRNPKYPYKFYYGNDDTRVEFNYKSQLERKLVFLATTTTNRDIRVKFVKRYSKEAHLLCANMGYAPKLHACESLAGGWIMIVTDYVDKNTYCSYVFKNSNFPPLEEIKSKTYEIVSYLHENKIVHGDLRRGNLLVRIDGKNDASILLANFDSAGEEGSIKYPFDINIKTIQRPPNVKGGELITKQNDVEMLEIMWEDLISDNNN